MTKRDIEKARDIADSCEDRITLIAKALHEARLEGREEAAVCAEHQDRFGQNHLTIAAAIRSL